MNMQLPGTAVGTSRPVVMADAHLVESCGDMLDAIILCIQLSRLSHEYVCEQLGIDKGHWSRMLSGRAHMNLKRVNRLMELCGNYAPLQWLAWSNGFALAHPEQFVADDRHARRAA